MLNIDDFKKQVLSMSEDELNLLKDCWDAQKFQPDPDTLSKPDKWTCLAIRILSYMDRDDAADGLDNEVHNLEQKATIV